MRDFFKSRDAQSFPNGRAALIVALVAAVLFQLAVAPVPAAPSPSTSAVDEERGLELIVAAYDVLQDRFFRPLDSQVLLGAAWDGARRGLGAELRSPPGVAAPQLVGDRQADLAEFSNQYRALLAAAGPGVNGVHVAMIAADAMTDSVAEQHTAFLTPEQFVQFKASLTASPAVVGLGIVIDGQRAPFTIEYVIPGAPAEQRGVLEGDQIEQVAGRATGGLELAEVSQLLRGEAGEVVTLGLRRGGQPLEVAITRARFIPPALRMRLLAEGVCYMRLTQFPAPFFPDGLVGRTVDDDLDAALQRCEQGGAQGWIMDLRGNGGGSTLALAQLLGRFMDAGPISVDRDRVGGRYEQATDGHLFPIQRPLVVLIDGGSASASEAFASAVQEYGRGVVVGQRSAGALNAANVLALPLDAGIFVATREVFTGRLEQAVDGVGVTPDVVLPPGSDPVVVPRVAIDLALQPPAGVGPLPAPPPTPEGAVFSEPELRAALDPVQLRAEDAELPEDAIIPGDLVLDHINWYASDSPNLDAGRQRGLRLGWRGSLLRWLGRGYPPTYAMDVQLYRDADGAHRDFREIYEPDEPRNPSQYRDVEPPITLGDDTRALIGTGQNEGRVVFAWRRGNANHVVVRTLVPGQPPVFDGVVRLAQIADARAAQLGR